MMKRVEGYNNLYRNDTGAIVNTDDAGYHAYIKKRKSQRDKDRTITDLGERLEKAQCEIAELKDLVLRMLEANSDK